jgi:hypothetical protein
MSPYLLYRNRAFSAMGFSGFEGRHYSLFEHMTEDMGEAANLQVLLTALAFKYILTGNITHSSIPDDPTLESERRQIFYGSAIGIPTFFVSKTTRNRLILKILNNTAKIRLSRRYPGYFRVYHLEYKKALIQILKEDAADLIEMMGLTRTIEDLSRRVESWSQYSAMGRLTRGVLNQAGARSPLELSAVEFNAAAERYYRETLKKRHMEEAFDHLIQEVGNLEGGAVARDHFCRHALWNLMKGKDLDQYIGSIRKKVVNNCMDIEQLKTFVGVLLLMIYADALYCQPKTNV